MKSRISNLPISDDYYSDRHGAPCKILRATHEVIHYIRNGHCIASMGRFQREFEPLTKAQAARIAEEIETAEHLKNLRAQRAA
jgi:predicted ThiF/HesA family dinucleotide-utilizing enzyme